MYVWPLMTVVDKGTSYIKHIVDYDDGGSSDYRAQVYV